MPLPRHHARSDTRPGSRADWACILRGMLILLVVFGHALQFISHGGRDTFWEDPLFRGLYMVHMPLFMALTGYFSVRPGQEGAGHDTARPNMAGLLARARRLIWPMLPWALLAALLKAASQDRWGALPAMVWGGFLNLYWFLWAAFLALVLVAIGARLGRAAPLFYSAILALLLSPVLSGLWLVLPLFAFTFPFFLAGRLWHRLEWRAASRRRERVWHRRDSGWWSRGRRGSGWRGRRAPLFWLPGLIALPVAVICFLLWDRQTYVYNNGADLLRDPARVTLMYLGAAAATLVAGMVAVPLARSLHGHLPGALLAGCGRVSLQIYLAQDLAFAGLRAFIHHIPGAGSEERAVQLLLALGITGLLTGVICLLLRGIAFPPRGRSRPKPWHAVWPEGFLRGKTAPIPAAALPATSQGTAQPQAGAGAGAGAGNTLPAAAPISSLFENRAGAFPARLFGPRHFDHGHFDHGHFGSGLSGTKKSGPV